MTDSDRQSAAATLGHARTACRRSTRSAPEHFVPAFEQRDARAPRRDRRHRATTPSRRPSPTPSRRSTRSGRDARRASSGCSSTSPRPRPRRRCRRSSARWRRASPRITARSTCTRRCSRASTRCIARRDELGLAPEQLRLLERIHLDFVRAGARLSAPAQGALRRRSSERLAELTTRFSQNVLADEAELPPRAARRARPRRPARVAARGRARGGAASAARPTRWMITLSRSLIVPFLTFSDRRDLREQAFKRLDRAAASNDGEHDNRPVAREILALRNEQARLHGYAQLRRLRAGRPDGRHARRGRAAARAGVGAGEGHAPPPSATRCGDGARAGRRRTRSSRGTGATTRRRCARRATTSTTRQLKPYFSLDRMLGRGVRHARIGCSGSRFVERPDLRAYHPDVARLRGARRATTALVGVFLQRQLRARRPSAAARG